MFSADDVKELEGLKPGERVKVKLFLMDLQQHQEEANSGQCIIIGVALTLVLN